MTGSDKDQVLAERVQDMSVPDHSSRFWDRLDEQLDQISFDRTTLVDDPSVPEDPPIGPSPAPLTLLSGDDTSRTVSRLRRHYPRRPWLIAVAAAVAVLAAAVGVLSTREDTQRVGTADDPAPTTIDRPDPTVPSTVPTTLGPPTTAGPPPVEAEPTVTFSEARAAAQAVYTAWQAGDRGQAARAATPEAVDVLFARPWTDQWTGSECEERPGGLVECFMDGDGEALVVGVRPDPTIGYRVSAVEFRFVPTAVYYPGVTVTPFAAPVGASVHIEGDGFIGEEFVPDPPMYLVGGEPDCDLYAPVDSQVEYSADFGHMVGEFVVPATGICRATGEEVAVTPGRYLIEFACTPCFIGEIQVV